jgi:rRNA maturation protein Nop10
MMSPRAVGAAGDAAGGFHMRRLVPLGLLICVGLNLGCPLAAYLACANLPVWVPAVSGEVKDAQSGEPIDGATVTIYEGDASDVQTTEEGWFWTDKFSGAGRYTLSVEAAGYVSQTIEVVVPPTFNPCDRPSKYVVVEMEPVAE